MILSTNKLDGVNDMNTLLDAVKEILEQSKSYQEDFSVVRNHSLMLY